MIRVPHRRRLIENTATLFGAQAVSLLVPLLTVPYLARTLRPSGWASVLIAQAVGNWLVLLIEYGFDLSGTRAVAQARSAPASLSEVIRGVQGAKLLLLPVAGMIVVILFLALPALRGDARLLGWTLAFAAFRGLNPFWYFQGIERVRAAAGVDSVSKAAGAFGVFVFVHAPADGWKVIALQALAAASSLAILTWRMQREVPMMVPRFRHAWSMLRHGAGVFGLRAASGLSVQANTIILAALSDPIAVSLFGGAERVVRASINLFQPLTQAFLPRLSFLSVTDPDHGRRTVARCLVFIGALGAVFGLVAFAGAPLLTQVLLGPGYEGAIPVMRTLALLPILVAVNTVLGLYWAIPFGHERAFLIAVVAGGATNVALALVFVPRWGAVGMGAAVVLAELTVTASLSSLFYRRHHRRVSPSSVVTSP